MLWEAPLPFSCSQQRTDLKTEVCNSLKSLVWSRLAGSYPFSEIARAFIAKKLTEKDKDKEKKETGKGKANVKGKEVKKVEEKRQNVNQVKTTSDDDEVMIVGEKKSVSPLPSPSILRSPSSSLYATFFFYLLHSCQLDSSSSFFFTRNLLLLRPKEDLIKRKILEKDPVLRGIYNDIVPSILTDSEFWASRKELLEKEAKVDVESVQRSGISSNTVGFSGAFLPLIPSFLASQKTRESCDSRLILTRGNSWIMLAANEVAHSTDGITAFRFTSLSLSLSSC